ncbi:glycoprotein [Killamcar virus 1]|nr:glycoprotein [Killamcar virus 1]
MLFHLLQVKQKQLLNIYEKKLTAIMYLIALYLSSVASLYAPIPRQINWERATWIDLMCPIRGKDRTYGLEITIEKISPNLEDRVDGFLCRISEYSADCETDFWENFDRDSSIGPFNQSSCLAAMSKFPNADEIKCLWIGPDFVTIYPLKMRYSTHSGYLIGSKLLGQCVDTDCKTKNHHYRWYRTTSPRRVTNHVTEVAMISNKYAEISQETEFSSDTTAPTSFQRACRLDHWGKKGIRLNNREFVIFPNLSNPFFSSMNTCSDSGLKSQSIYGKGVDTSLIMECHYIKSNAWEMGVIDRLFTPDRPGVGYAYRWKGTFLEFADVVYTRVYYENTTWWYRWNGSLIGYDWKDPMLDGINGFSYKRELIWPTEPEQRSRVPTTVKPGADDIPPIDFVTPYQTKTFDRLTPRMCQTENKQEKSFTEKYPLWWVSIALFLFLYSIIVSFLAFSFYKTAKRLMIQI